MAACFLPCKINLVLQKKKKVCQKYPNFKRGDPYDLGRRPLQPVKNYKSQLFLGGFGHPNFMHPFEFVGKSFLDKLFTKRIGTITQTKP